MFSHYLINHAVDESVHLQNLYGDNRIFYYQYAHRSQLELSRLAYKMNRPLPPEFNSSA